LITRWMIGFIPWHTFTVASGLVPGMCPTVHAHKGRGYRDLPRIRPHVPSGLVPGMCPTVHAHKGRGYYDSNTLPV